MSNSSRQITLHTSANTLNARLALLVEIQQKFETTFHEVKRRMRENFREEEADNLKRVEEALCRVRGLNEELVRNNDTGPLSDRTSREEA